MAGRSAELGATPAGPASIRRHAEETVWLEINRFRQAQGLKPLVLRAQLQQAAREHSLSMARYGYFGHKDMHGRTVRERLLERAVTDWRELGENIAKELGSATAALQVCQNWMNSPGHRRNIIRPAYSETGVGAAMDSDGNILFTQVFMAR